MYKNLLLNSINYMYINTVFSQKKQQFTGVVMKCDQPPTMLLSIEASNYLITTTVTVTEYCYKFEYEIYEVIHV